MVGGKFDHSTSFPFQYILVRFKETALLYSFDVSGCSILTLKKISYSYFEEKHAVFCDFACAGLTGTTGSLVEHSLRYREVVGSNTKGFKNGTCGYLA